MGIREYRKHHTQKKIFKLEKSNLVVPKQGLYGLKAVTCGFITPQQLETARRIVSRITKRLGKLYIKVKFEQALTKKPLLSRMGKGCGSFYMFISYLKKGKLILELLGVSKHIAIIALNAVCKRLSTLFEIVQREVIDV